MTAWHFAVNGQAQGPVSAQQLRDILATGSLGADPLVWTEGMAEWLNASEIAELRNPEPQPPPPAPLFPGQFAQSKSSPARASSARISAARVATTRGSATRVSSEKFPSTRIPPARIPPARVSQAQVSPIEASLAQAALEQESLEQLSPEQLSPQQAAAAQLSLPQASPEQLATTPVPSPSPVDSAAATDLTQNVPAPAASLVSQFRVGLVLARSVTILRARIGTWLLIGLIETVLAVPLAFLSAIDTAGVVPIAFLPAADATGKVVSLLICMQVQAMIAFAAFQLCCGQDVRLAEAFKQGGIRLPAVSGVFVVTALLLFFSAALSATLGLVLLQALTDTSFATLSYAIAAIPAALSFLLLSSIILIRTAVSIAACVNESLNPITAFSRSFLLTRGRLWKIFGAYFVLLLTFLAFLAILIGLSYLAVVLIDPAFPITRLIDPSLPITSLNHLSSIIEAPPAILAILGLLFFIFLPGLWLFSAFTGILGTTIFANLRMISEASQPALLPARSE